MLTAFYRLVNSVAMEVDYTQDQSSRSAQHKLAEQLLLPLLARRRPERVLVLKHANAGDLHLELMNTAQLIRLSADPIAYNAPLQCRIEALPFEEAAFDLVILHHLVADGGEEYLVEALRVLAAGGDIVISGLNSSGLRTHIVNRKNEVPALKLNRICKLLKSQSFNIEQCMLMGLCGFSRPAARATWHGLGYPFADRVVLHGHHQSNITNVRPLSFSQLKSGAGASAALDGCSSREVVS